MTLLDRLYEAQNMDLGDISVSQSAGVDVIRLRAIVDNVREQLPPLLELGQVPRVSISHHLAKLICFVPNFLSSV